MSKQRFLWAAGVVLLAGTPAWAGYVELWTIASTSSAAAASFDLGDDPGSSSLGTTHFGSQGAWGGGTAHSARSLHYPAIGSHEGGPLGYIDTNTVFGDTDGDGTVEFVSADASSAELHVWSGATGMIEDSIPYPAGASDLKYILLIDVNASDGAGTCEIIVHWATSGLIDYATTCYSSDGLVGVSDPAPQVPPTLGQNAPNPFSSTKTTAMRYALPSAGLADLRIYDVQGRVVRVLSDGYKEAGVHVTTWDGKNEDGRSVASGVYYYELRSESGDQKRTAVVVR